MGLTVDEEVKLVDLDIKRLEAVAKLDEVTGVPSQWVVDLRSSFRYIAACVSIVAGIGLGYTGLYEPTITSEEMAAVILPLATDLIGIPFSFIFGERLWQGLKGVRK